MVTLLLFMTGSAMAYSVTLTDTEIPVALGVYGDSGNIPYHNSTLFDFSAEGFDKIESFEIDLTYTGAQGQNFFLPNPLNIEYWRVRFADGTAAETWAKILLGPTHLTGTSYNYTFNTSDSKFAFMDTDKAFTLWFAEESSNTHYTLFGTKFDNDQFKLTSVSITATGTAAVPIPAGILLLASGLLGFVGIRRRNS
jgi:hypothetical protein